MEEWKCPKCGENKPLTEDFWIRNNKASTGFTTSNCKICSNAYYRNYYRNRYKRNKAKALNDRLDEPFYNAALKDEVKRLVDSTKPITSIYQEI